MWLHRGHQHILYIPCMFFFSRLLSLHLYFVFNTSLCQSRGYPNIEIDRMKYLNISIFYLSFSMTCIFFMWNTFLYLVFYTFIYICVFRNIDYNNNKGKYSESKNLRISTLSCQWEFLNFQLFLMEKCNLRCRGL